MYDYLVSTDHGYQIITATCMFAARRLAKQLGYEVYSISYYQEVDSYEGL